MKLHRIQFTAIVIFSLLISNVSFASNINPKEDLSQADKERLEEIKISYTQLESRVHELKEAKRIAKSRTEKKVIRQELKELKNEMKALTEEEEAISGGV